MLLAPENVPLCVVCNDLRLDMIYSPEIVVGKLLAVRRSLRGTEWDGTHLDHFVQILCRLDNTRHGFAVDDLQAIESAWVGEAGEFWSGGFVVRLKDGRRAHVDGRAGESHWSEDSDIEAGFLDTGEPHPELGARYGWHEHAWSEGLARGLNEFLGRFAALPPRESSR